MDKGYSPDYEHYNCDILAFVENRLHKIFCRALLSGIIFATAVLSGLMELCTWQEAGSLLIVSFGLFLLPHLAATLVIRLVDAVLALRGFLKS